MPSSKDQHLALALHEFAEIVQTGIVSPQRSESPLFWPAMSRILAILHDCTTRAASEHKLLLARQSVGTLKGQQVDLPILLKRARNAASHLFSGERSCRGNIVSRCMSNNPDEFKFPSSAPPTETGDMFLIWGEISIAMAGDLGAAFNWLRERFAPELPALRFGGPPRK